MYTEVRLCAKIFRLYYLQSSQGGIVLNPTDDKAQAWETGRELCWDSVPSGHKAHAHSSIPLCLHEEHF